MYLRLAGLLIACAFVSAAESSSDPRSLEAQRMIHEGHFPEAAQKLREVYDDTKKSGIEDVRMSNAAAELAGAYIFLDRLYDAEPLIREAIRIDEGSGPDSLDAARHAVVLSKLYISQGRFADGEKLLLRMQPILERGYGPESPQVAALMNQLGLASDMLDRVPEATAFYRRAIAIYEKQAPAHRGLIAVVISNLVALLIDKGQYDEALRMSERAIQEVERGYGPDHPYTARALHNIGTAYQALGKMDEAQRRYERALAIWDRHPGVGSLDAAAAQCSLAAVYIDQGYFSRAEALLNKALVARERVLGPVSAELASGLNNLGVLYAKQNRLTEAKKILERGLAMAEQTIGRTHARILPLLTNLGWIYYAEGRYQKDSYLKAEAMYRRVLALQESRFGPDRIEVSDALSNLAAVCAVEKNYREAKQLEERALSIRRVVLGPEHPATVKTFKEYTFLLRKSKE